MIIIYGFVKTKANMNSKFVQTLCEIQNEIRKMEGCVRNEWYQVPGSLHRYVIYGEFDTKENFEKYLGSSAVKRIDNELIPLLDAPPEIKHYADTCLESS